MKLASVSGGVAVATEVVLDDGMLAVVIGAPELVSGDVPLE
ncbi:MAG: hypothetical protein ABI421_00095 [Polyangiaceae bacterium]